MYTGGSAGLLEADGTVHAVEVGEGKGVHAQIRGALDQVAGGGAAGEEGEPAAGVEVYKVRGHGIWRSGGLAVLLRRPPVEDAPHLVVF